MSERKITASSTSAIYHVCPLNPTEEIIDFADHVKVLSHVLADMIYNRKPKLIAIEGETCIFRSIPISHFGIIRSPISV